MGNNYIWHGGKAYGKRFFVRTEIIKVIHNENLPFDERYDALKLLIKISK